MYVIFQPVHGNRLDHFTEISWQRCFLIHLDLPRYCPFWLPDCSREHFWWLVQSDRLAMPGDCCPKGHPHSYFSATQKLSHYFGQPNRKKFAQKIDRWTVEMIRKNTPPHKGVFLKFNVACLGSGEKSCCCV